MNHPLQLRPGPLYQGSKPARDPEYRRFIKRLPCVGCGTTWWIDPAHTGPHALNQKSDDRSCIPLCWKCHQEYDAYPWKFVFKYKLDIPALIEMFNSFYQAKLRGKAA
jgi:hypothetical protein